MPVGDFYVAGNFDAAGTFIYAGGDLGDQIPSGIKSPTPSSPCSLKWFTPFKSLLSPSPCSLKWSTTTAPATTSTLTFTNRYQSTSRRFRTIGVNHASWSGPLLVHTTAIGYASW